jgi:hypothetical protein
MFNHKQESLMNDLKPLPTYTKEKLAELSPSKLIDIIIEDADRVPRNVIDECVLRGEEMTEYLNQLHKDDFLWSEEQEGEDGLWWLRLHTVMILGLMQGELAGLLLVELMRCMSVEDDENLQGWLSGYWPALFQNKPSSVLPALRELCLDQKLDWYIRTNAIDTVIASAARQDDASLNQALAWLAEIVANEEEEWILRLSAGNTLLDFPRPQYRQLLEEMASKQTGWDIHFSMGDVQHAYGDLFHEPEWERFKNPWEFYKPDAITQRQIRWQEEDMQASLRNLADDAGDFDETDFPDFDFPDIADSEPYIRPEAKTGRNDPCPCGSGKKYKKCCLAKE